jgi:hypothetical protein
MRRLINRNEPTERITLSGARPIVLIAAVWVLTAALFGCSTVKGTAKDTARVVGDTSRKVSNVFTTGDSGLKARIALIGIESGAPGGPIGFPSFFQNSMARFVQTECPGRLIDETIGELLKQPPRLRSGSIDGYSLSLLGRPKGLNFFVIGTLTDVRLLDEKTGFWLWKDTIFHLRAVMRVEIIDSATGTKTLDETYTEDVEIEELRSQQLKEAQTIPLAEIEPILNRLMREAGYKLCAQLRDQPWRGFVVAVEQNRITVSSGGAAGLSPGMVLEVYGSGSVVENRDGQRFQKPGDKIGEATVSSVTEDQAIAILGGSAPVSVGGTVRPKR